jgi:DNA-binding NtrC family response regulator
MRRTSRGVIVGRDSRLELVLETIDRVARSSCTVLVTGESGTGKELVIAALHDASARKEGPLVTVNCHTLGANLDEAITRAEGGTLFLDEIGDLGLPIQAQLLRLLEPLKCEVRIVAATNRDLAPEVKAGRFREDLYYRLNVIRLALPPLRERRGDLRLLAKHFFTIFGDGREDLRGLSEEALSAIEKSPWPGNVRELENAIERGVLLARGPFVEPADLFGHPRPPIFSIPPAIPSKLPEGGVCLFATLEAYENSLVKQALRRTQGNRNKAARLLGMNRTTLVEMIRRRGLSS